MGVRQETTHSTNDPSKTGMLTNRRMKLDLYLSSCTKKKIQNISETLFKI